MCTWGVRDIDPAASGARWAGCVYTRYPNTYNGKPLCIAALGAHQKYNSLYLMGAYGSPSHRKALEDGFRTE